MKVLVVEDDTKIAAALRRGLTAEGFSVDVAHDGEDGLWMATESSFDVLIIDLMLPGRNGYQICASLRAAGDWTPILVLTAKSGEFDEAESLDTGADDFLSKPFSFTVLVSRLRALARRGTRRSPVVDRIGDLQIDSATRRVVQGEQEIGLTAREFDVLEFFVRNVDQVLSKSDILAGVWNADFDGDANIVEVYVRRLRRKLWPVATTGATLETIRGAGYRLADSGAVIEPT